MRLTLALVVPLLALHAACAKREAPRQTPKGTSPAAETTAPAPKPAGPEPAAPVPQRLDFEIDGDGQLSVLEGADFGKEFPEGKPSPHKPVAWADLPATLRAACERAAREYAKPPGAGEPRPDQDPRRTPRLLLRWNPTIKKCKVYVGQVLCNYNEQGIERARARLRETLAADGSGRVAELDAGTDVPMAWALEALRLMKEEGVESPWFTGRAEAPFEGAPERVQKRFGGKDDKGAFSPDVAVLVRVAPETDFGRFRAVLEQCACHEIRKVFLRGKPGETLPVFLPADVPVDADPPGK